MRLKGLHFLLSYKCTHKCDHCFVWGSPFAQGTFTMAQIREVYRQAEELDTIEVVFFEGGEPFLFFPIMVRAVAEGRALGWRVGIVSNAYWATAHEDALEWLRPLAEVDVSGVDLSSDLYHGDADAEGQTEEANHGAAAAAELGIASGTMHVETPECSEVYPEREGGTLMYRGRAVANLLEGVPRHPWQTFTECPHEELEDPDRIHLDPFGHLHLCQGISMGNLFQTSLKDLVETYDPQAHPIVGPLLAGGPAELVRRYDLQDRLDDRGYADACHLCYRMREQLRERFPEILAPDQVYGVGLPGE